jgi:biotin synthase
MSLLSELESKLLVEDGAIDADEAQRILDLGDDELPALVALAHRVRLARCGPEVEVESIISAKTGGCPEDCAFCSQSRHWPTTVRPEPFLDTVELVEAARRSQDNGATEFCIVLAVRGPDDRIMEQVLKAVDALHDQTDMQVACSLGILTREQAQTLADAGVHRYNHNLETARSYFTKIVTTHSWEERHGTCMLVKDVGMELCCGGILGMGESREQRVEFAMDLRSVGPCEVPINFLNPRPGTPLADRPLVSPLDAIRTIALFRLVFPDAILRYAGGREVTLRELQSLGLLAGINGIIIGNYLTTLGREPEQDLKMLDDLRMPVKAIGI